MSCLSESKNFNPYRMSNLSTLILYQVGIGHLHPKNNIRQLALSKFWFDRDQFDVNDSKL